MGGSSPSKTSKKKGPGPAPQGADRCDIEINIDLIGIDPKVLAGVSKGDVLPVVLKTAATAKSVVIVAKGGVVGSLAAVRGLAQLIRCIEDDVEYQATVQSVSKTSCNVLVQRA